MSPEAKLTLALAIATAVLNLLAEAAKRFGWTRIQWFIEAITPLAVNAAGRAAAAPKNAKQIDDVSRVIAAAQDSSAITLTVIPPVSVAPSELEKPTQQRYNVGPVTIGGDPDAFVAALAKASERDGGVP